MIWSDRWASHSYSDGGIVIRTADSCAARRDSASWYFTSAEYVGQSIVSGTTAFSRRTNSASTTPSEALLRSTSRSYLYGSTPRIWANRFHSASGSAPDCGTVITWIRSGGIAEPHRSSTLIGP